jgi:hypothetical protein
MPGFCPGFMRGENGAESHQRYLHATRVAAQKYGAWSERRAWKAGSASSTRRADHCRADNRRCSGGVSLRVQVCSSKRRGDKSARSTPCIRVPAPPIFQVRSRVMTSLTRCDAFIRGTETTLKRERSLCRTYANGSSAAPCLTAENRAHCAAVTLASFLAEPG